MLKIVNIRGGLGNQMFGYAFLLFLKQTSKLSYVSLDAWELLSINLFNLTSVFPKIKRRSDKFYHYQYRFYTNRFLKKYFTVVTEDRFKEKNVNGLVSIYDGYWQSEIFFEPIKERVREEFVFELNSLNIHTQKILNYIKSSNAVSIHIRRGDYLEHIDVFGNICTHEYYKKAIMYLEKEEKNCVFFIFSDDAEWVKTNFDLPDNYHIIDFNKNSESWQDMFLMSECKHNIIANSTFSWWGAWLNNNSEKIIICPSRWMNNHLCENITPNTWIKIDV